MLHYNLNITQIPTYLDGSFKLYEIVQEIYGYPKESIKRIDDADFYFKQLSLTDKIIFENEKRDRKIQMKIRIPQNKNITSQNVLYIDKNFYKVFNTYHFTNTDGYPESDITLETYENPEVIESDE